MPNRLSVAILETVDHSLLEMVSSGRLSKEDAVETLSYILDQFGTDLSVEDLLDLLNKVMAKYPFLVPSLVRLDLKDLCIQLE